MFVVEFIVHYQMCDDCRRREASDFWRAVVQVRQRVHVDGIAYAIILRAAMHCLSRQMKRKRSSTWSSWCWSIMHMLTRSGSKSSMVNVWATCDSLLGSCSLYVTGGLDFFYGTKQDARRLVDFLLSAVPCRYKTAQQLISHDIRNNVYNYKHTFSVEIVPLAKVSVTQ